MQVTILDVATAPGSDFKRGWKHKMQIVHTDKGQFIDNSPGASHGHWIGHDWEQDIHQTVEATTLKQYGLDWIKRIK